MTRIKWLESIRILAILLVFIYHVFHNSLPGGFIGVDIFFALSGFLITAGFLHSYQKKKTFHYVTFIKKRILRIWPVLFSSVLFTLPLTIFSRDLTVGITRQVAAALSFTTNWFEIMRGGEYEAQLLPPIYEHIWYLAVDFQILLLWGVVLLLLSRIKKSMIRGVHRTHQMRIFILLCAGFLILISSIYRTYLLLSGANLSQVYYNTLSHMTPFMIGAAFSPLWGFSEEKQGSKHIRTRFMLREYVLSNLRRAKFIAGITCGVVVFILLLMSRLIQFSSVISFHISPIITPILTVVFIYVIYSLNLIYPEAKNPRILQLAGELTYEVYLTHWPIFVILSTILVNNAQIAILTCVITLCYTVVFHLFRYFYAHKQSIRINGKFIIQWKAVVLFGFGMGVLSFVICIFVFLRAPLNTSVQNTFVASQITQDVTRVQADFELVYASVKPDIPVANVPPDSTTDSTPEVTDSQKEIYQRVMMFGDSVTLGALPMLQKVMPGITVDAVESREIKHGAPIVLDLQNQGKLSDIVVIALGTNADYNDDKRYTDFIQQIQAGTRLVFVTPFDGRSNLNARLVGENAQFLRTLPDLYPFITIADWNAVIQPQQNLLAGDRIHMNSSEGMRLFAETVQAGIEAAIQKPAKQ